MAKKEPSKSARAQKFEYVEPIGLRVLVRKDEPKKKTKGGIALPDSAEIPTITGRIVTISAAIEHDEDLPLRQYDKVLFHPGNAIPISNLTTSFLLSRPKTSSPCFAGMSQFEIELVAG